LKKLTQSGHTPRLLQEQINSSPHDQKHNTLASEKIGTLLWKLSLPAGIGMFVMTLYNVVDTIFIGHVVGPLGIAGLSIVFPVQMLIMGMGLMVGIGGASLISRSLGTRDPEKAARTLGNAILGIIVLGILITLVGLSDSLFWLRLMGASETVLPFAREYLDVILLGASFQLFAMGASHLVRAEGNARVPMISMLIGGILNIILDACFIVGLSMGIRGAAIATVISHAVSSAYLIYYYLSGNSSLKIYAKNLIPNIAIVREITLIGVGEFARTSATSLVIVLVNRSLSVYGGDMAVAAFGIMHRIMMFVIMPNISVGQGLQPILGFNYGSKRTDRVLRVIKLSIIAATIFSVTAFLVLFFFSAPIMRIFTDERSLIGVGSHAAKLIFSVAFLVGFQVVGSVVFQAIGKALPAFLTAISRQILFFLPLILILPRFFKLNGVWMSFPLADVLSFFLCLLLLVVQIREIKDDNPSAR